nr:hypothetical protein [Asaia astilbis]
MSQVIDLEGVLVSTFVANLFLALLTLALSAGALAGSISGNFSGTRLWPSSAFWSACWAFTLGSCERI